MASYCSQVLKQLHWIEPRIPRKSPFCPWHQKPKNAIIARYLMNRFGQAIFCSLFGTKCASLMRVVSPQAKKWAKRRQPDGSSETWQVSGDKFDAHLKWGNVTPYILRVISAFGRLCMVSGHQSEGTSTDQAWGSWAWTHIRTSTLAVLSACSGIRLRKYADDAMY